MGNNSKEYRAAHYLKNRDKILAKNKKYKEENKEKVLAAKRDYWARNSERLNAEKKEYRLTEDGKDVIRRKNLSQRLKRPLQYKANTAVGNALRDGRLIKEPCAVPFCTSHDSEAHHNDYNFPLKVTWLCQKHHNTWHKIFKPIYPSIN